MITINWRLFNLLLLAMVFVTISSCELEKVEDPNNPSLGSVTSDASKAELQTLVYGLEARHRGYYTNATQMFGVFGREVYAFFGSDPRFKTDWQGNSITETYPDFFASAGTYVTPYLAVKQANVLITAANNSTQLTAEEAAGYTGFAKTIKGYQLIFPLMQQYQNGIRVDVEDPLNPGPTLGYDDALSAIRDILDDGFSDLASARDEFSFDLTFGFDGFDTPEGMQEINRAMAARVALYDEDWQGALDALDQSYLNLDVMSMADLYAGPSHPYGNAPDVNNPLFYPFDAPTSTILIVHPGVIEDLPEGDGRAFKFAERTENILTDGNIQDADGNAIPGVYQDARWDSNIDDIEYLRNEELILIYAEANARLGNTDDAVDAINIIRGFWGIGMYDGDTDTESLIDEILFQRRFSLWAEAGQRWIDLRRTGRLNSDYVDLREGGNIFTQVARRVSEISWDEG